MIGRAEIASALERVRGHVRRTPVLHLEAGALGLDFPLVLKLEHLQRTGSFKVRGAFNTLLSQKVPAVGVAAISGGNHGAAVALAATGLGVPSTVYVPSRIADPVKADRMRSLGATVVVAEGSVDDAIAEYEAFARETGALAVHPYDAPATVAGQGTVAAELEEQAPEIDTLLVSVGGGGLIGGIAAWYAGRVKVVAVETEGTCCLALELKGALPKDFHARGLSASGLGASRIGTLPMAIIRNHVAANVVVSDADVMEAQRRLWAAARVVAEPGGVTALAALTSGAYCPAKAERVAVLICGGNADPGWFADRT